MSSLFDYRAKRFESRLCSEAVEGPSDTSFVPRFRFLIDRDRHDRLEKLVSCLLA